MRKIIVSALLSVCFSCTNKQSKNSNMELTNEVNRIVSYLPSIQVFEGKDNLDSNRRGYENMANQLSGKKEPVKVIEECSIEIDSHKIPVRIYRPQGILKDAKSSAIVYLHGGWFISGSFETHDAVVRKLANATNSIIVFPEYRLAPEHPFPAGFDDSLAITNWLFDHADSLGVDSEKIGIVGDSAGAALACTVTVELPKQLRFQVLIYPASDNNLNTPSWKKYANGPILTKEGAVQAWDLYLSDQKDKHNPLAVPILINDFKKTPETLILLAEHDPLHDEGRQLAINMEKARVKTKTISYKNMIHGFMHMGSVLNETQLVAKEIAVFTNERTK